MSSKNYNNQLNGNNTSENLHEQNHKHGFFSHFHGHSHTHGKVDPSTLATSKGLWAVKWSFIAMIISPERKILGSEKAC